MQFQIGRAANSTECRRLHGLMLSSKPLRYSLNSLGRVIWGILVGVIKRDTRSLDYSSFASDRQEFQAGALKGTRRRQWFDLSGVQCSKERFQVCCDGKFAEDNSS